MTSSLTVWSMIRPVEARLSRPLLLFCCDISFKVLVYKFVINSGVANVALKHFSLHVLVHNPCNSLTLTSCHASGNEMLVAMS